MKHKNLFFKTCVLLVCFLFMGLVSLNAQTWTAPTLTGSTLTTGTTYYMYNVGSNGYLNRGGNYLTQAVVSAAPTANAAPATIIKWTATNTTGSIWTFQYNNGANVSNNYLFPSNASSADGSVYTDNSTNDTWNLVQTDATNKIYSIQVVSSYGGYSAAQYLGTAAATEATNSGIANVVRYNRTSSTSTQWKFVSQADLDLYNAKVLLDRYMTYGKNRGIDITTYLTTYNAGVTASINTAASTLLTAIGRTTISFTNNSFESAALTTGWTNGGSFARQTNAPGQGWTKDGSAYCEKFTASSYGTSGSGVKGYLGIGTITQAVSGLSSGMYELVVSGHAVQQAGANPLHTGAFITAGASSTEVVAGKDYSIENINVSTGSLTVGYSIVAPVACNWTGIDNFRLYYYGAVISNIYTSKTSFDLSATPFHTTFDLGGANLTNDITITPPVHITLSSASPNLVDNGNGTYTLTATNANASTITITATWDTSAIGSGNIQLSSTGATSKTIAVTASTDPSLIVDNSTLAFTPHTSTRTVTVTGANLTDDVTLAFSNGNFSTVRSLTILKADVMALGGVTFNVDCSATAAASGTLTVTANSITRTINLASSASDALTINTRSFFVDQSTANNLQFTVSQGDLYSISLTAPAGITLTKTSDGSPLSSITNANVYSGSFGVTATWDGTTRINNGKIRLTTNGQNDSIVAIAIPKNLISSWDGDNNTAATSASYPSAYGWDETTADGVTSASPTWQYYNGSGNIRYVPVTGPGHQYLNKAITFGRSCYFRNWGTSGANKFNLVTPTLTAGVTYQFNGIACLNSNASTGTLTLSVNSAKSNVGTSLGSQSVYFSSTLSASKYSYQFTPVTTSVYYLVVSTDQSADVILSPDYLSIDSIGDTRPALHTASNISVDVAGATWNTAFAPSTLNYIVHVPVETTSVTPTVTKAFSGETVSGDGTVTLIDGEGTSTIVVTSQDANSSTTYNFRYTTKSGDATLSNLVVSSGSLKPAFNAAVTSYTVYLANGTTASSSAATKANAGATVSGDGAISLTNGVATSNVLVTAEDGVTAKTYTITYSGLALMHSYTFDDGANDSPANGASAVNGTLYNNTTTATISGGKFTASTTAAGVAADVTNTGDFIALNGAALALNTYPGITVEAYITASNAGNAGFTMFSYFGGATGSNAFYTSLARNDNVSRASYADTYNASGIELEDGALHHVVSILTKDSVYLYTDGYLSAKALNVKPISDLSSTYAYLCKSGWGDPTWVGTIDEFNIYTGRMDAATIKTRALAYVPATVYTAATENIISVNKSASEIIVQPGAKLTLNSGIQLAANSITLQSDATGTATFVNSGTTAIATANVQQYLSSGRNWYISSPVSGATSAAITGTTANSLVSYNEVDGTWPAAGTTLTAGKGYIAVSPTSSAAVTFTGTLNTGAQSYTLYRTDSLVQKRGFNLVGNPYPSYLNWESATRTNVGPTMWYRSKDAGQYVFATYGAVSKIGTSLGGTPVTNFIPPMQAFWVRVSGAGSGTLAFDNSMRSHSATSNLLKAPTASKTTQQVLRLQVSNGVNNDEAIIIFNENATNGFDDYDSPKMSNANASIPEIYTMVGSEKLVINGLTSVAPNEELALGFTTGQSNSFSIKATQISNFDAGTRIYLRDNLLNTEQELTNTTDYTFSSDIASTSSRFSVVFKSAGVTTGINNADANITISKNTNNQITVNCKGDINTGATVSVYNALGQKIQSKQITETRTILSTEFTSGVYVVTVNNGGKSVTQKVTLN
jgi:hypothetical protein